MADRYPKSVYARTALPLAIGTAWNGLSDGELAYRITGRLLRQFPDLYWEGIYFLSAYYSTKGDTVAFKIELDSIIKANSHPKLTAAARQELKKLEVKK